MHCIVCAEETTKYKCVKCSAFYCSVKCYKMHKDSTVCQQQQQQTLNLEAAGAGADDQSGGSVGFFQDNEPFSTDATVPREQLEELRHSSSLPELFNNPHLRNLLHEIDQMLGGA